MSDMELDPEGTVSVTEAAAFLGMTGAEAYELVFRGALKTVATPSGRRVVPLEVIRAWKRDQTEAGVPTPNV
jgi:hypothetical protein